MLHIYDKDPGYRTSFRAADFYSLLSAYDETASRNLGISQNIQDDVRRLSVFQGKGKLPRKNKDETVFSKEINTYEYGRPKTLQPTLTNNDFRDIARPNHVTPVGLIQQHRMGFSSSLPQALEKISLDLHNSKRWIDSPISTNSNISSNQSKTPTKNQVKRVESSQNTRKPSIIVRQVDAKAESMTMGLPNCRGLPTIPKTPRILRTRVFFNQIKMGLKEHIEWHTTQLQQAELDQDIALANKASENVNQLQHRLNTIRCLEHEYMKHWKLYKELRSRSQGELFCELTNCNGINGKCGVENAYSCQHSSGTDSLTSLSKNKLSKSTLALTGCNEFDYAQPSRINGGNINSTHFHHQQNSNSHYDTSNYLPTILEKRPKYSSLMNLIRHKSKKATNNNNNNNNPFQNDSRPRAVTTIDPRYSALQSNKQSNSDLSKTPQMSTTLYSNNNNQHHHHHSKGLSRLKSNARDVMSIDSSLKQQQEVLIKRLCQIEAQTEYLSGTLICEVIGISGSLSSLSRDIFKISLKYGSPDLSSVYELQCNDNTPDIRPLYTSTIPLSQKSGSNDKWTITGRLSSTSFSYSSSVLSPYSNNSSANLQTTYSDDTDLKFPAQKWDHTKHIFSPTVGDVLTIKAVMTRRFGKPEVLVQQACDILNLLTFKGHHISVGLKHFTDLQFHFILKWCPLADTKDDCMLFYNLSSAHLATFMDEQKQKASSIRFLLDDEESSEPSIKDDYHRVKRSHTDSFSHESQHRQYNDEQHITNLVRTEACSSDFIVPQDDPDSSDLENKGSITILTVRSNRITPSRRCNSSRYPSNISKWISLPELEITRETSESEIKPSEVKVITVRTQPPDTGIRNGHQINGTDTLANNTVVNNPSTVSNNLCNYYNYYDTTPDDDNHIYISETVIGKQKQQINEAQIDEESLASDEYLPDSMNIARTSPISMSASKPTDSQLFIDLNKLKDKIDSKMKIHYDQPELLKDLNKALTNLIQQLEDNSYRFNQLSIIEQSGKTNLSKTFEKSTDKQNTLKSLWESLAFLDEPEKSLNEFVEDRATSSISESSQSLRVCENSGEQTNANIEQIKTTGWEQLDLALIWHLNYTTRLLDRVYPDHIYENNSQKLYSSDAYILDVSEKLVSNNGCSEAPNLMLKSIHSAWSALALSEQIKFFHQIENLCQGIINDQDTAESEFLLKIIGDGKPYSTVRFTCFLSKLIWPLSSSHNTSLSEDISSAQIIFDREAFREILLNFFEKEVVPRWSKDMGKEVIDQFIEDVLDLDVNGSDISTVPLTHLNLRLKLSERMESLPLSNCLLDSNNREQYKQFNVYFIQLLSYLAGQLHIQWNLENAYTSRTLSTLPYFTRALQPIFSLNILFEDAGVHLSQLNQKQTIGLDMRSIELAACHSTQTWLRVAELIGNQDEEINKKATMLLKSMNDKINRVFQYLMDSSKQTFRLTDTPTIKKKITNPNSIHQNYESNPSRNSIQYPIFYLAGSPIHIQYCLKKNNIQYTPATPPYLLSPIWMSMLWGLEQKSNVMKRIAALKALSMLIESDVSEKLKTTSNHHHHINKSYGQYDNSTDKDKTSMLLKLLKNMRSNETDPLVKEVMSQVIDKITIQVNNESHHEQISKPTRLLKTIWTKLSNAENLPSKPSYIFRSQ
ncbi:unnamed protein product [Trichobilharzia szidati]|nr:unnamed protein product [Trichobilharzia szidati]